MLRTDRIEKGKIMNVFLCEFIHPVAKEYLERHSTILSSYEALGQADAVLSRNLRIDAEFMDKTPNLKVIGVHGTGTDGVDLEEAKRRGIQVFSTPHMNSQSVAELNLAMAMMLSRKLNEAHLYLGSNAPVALKGVELQGKKAGFIGTGEIARRSAKLLCGGFGMQAIGVSPSYTKERAKGNLIACADSLQQVLCEADYLFICAPLTNDTRQMIGEKELAWMKPTAFLINCARGGIVEENALYKALLQKALAGAACDVFEREPVTQENPLLELDNFIATPHIGANTEEALLRVGMAAAQGIIYRLENGKS